MTSVCTVEKRGNNCMGKRLYVGNLPYNATNPDLKSWFESNGSIVEDAFVVFDRETQRSKGFGFVTVEDSNFQDSLKLNGGDFNGRALRINEAIEKSAGSRPAGFQPRSSFSGAPAPGYSDRYSPPAYQDRGPPAFTPPPSNVRFGDSKPPRSTSSEFDKPKRKSPQEQRRPKNNKRWEDYSDD